MAENPTTTHELKCWPEFFDAIARGEKRHELRRTDRNFQVGDLLLLHEWDPRYQGYTGEHQWVRVIYITSAASVCAFSPQALAEGFCIMSIEVCKWPHL